MDISEFWKNLITAFDVYTLLAFLVYFIVGVVTLVLFLRHFLRKEIRVFRNLRRKIYFLKTGPATMDTERGMLTNNGLFVVNDRVLDLTSETTTLQTLNDFSVFVVGYSPNYRNYQFIIDHAKNRSIPLVVYAKPTEITTEHLAVFQQYIYFEMCNSPARLLTVVFNLSLVAPYAKK